MAIDGKLAYPSASRYTTTAVFIPFEPQPSREELPAVFPTPFRPGTPHPLAERAALESQAFIDAHPELTHESFAGPVGGKMMGVLVCADPEGRVGYLRAFAGTLEGRWLLDGFVPPAFDLARFESIMAAGNVEITRIDEAIKAAHDESQRLALRHEQRELSRSLHARLYPLYELVNQRGETTSMIELFAPRSPPGGAGDCAAPKLLAAAHRMGARPLALAEFWWGSPPPAGGRQQGAYYPACRGRCAKILPFMLEGLELEPAPDFGIKPVPDEAPRVIYEDEHILVVDKPAGLLSVRGRGPNRQDCVEARLQSRFVPDDPDWPKLVHRLDLATSGLLVAAKHREAYVNLQQQFSRREIRKHYVAVIAGRPPQDSGVVDFPIGRDLDDRPRQKFDPEHGKEARTRYETLAEEGQHTRLRLWPETGRTHQLRLHAAHERGLGHPIVGDWIYGFGGERLLLHARGLALVHPHHGEALTFESDCPF